HCSSFFTCSRDHPALHSFPTRRSSDLRAREVDGVHGITACARASRAPRAGTPRPPRRKDSARSARTRSAPSPGFPGACAPPATRSEEHTSELQSRFDLVCRLLLEKKKQ